MKITTPGDTACNAPAPPATERPFTADGSFLYDADAQRVHGWKVGDDGRVEPVGSFDGLPATVAGLAAS